MQDSDFISFSSNVYPKTDKSLSVIVPNANENVDKPSKRRRRKRRKKKKNTVVPTFTTTNAPDM